MPKNQPKSIFEMDLDDFKSNFDKKYGGGEPQEYLQMQNWTLIGMLLKLHKKLVLLEDAVESVNTALPKNGPA